MDTIAAAVLLLFVLVGARQGLVRALAGLVIVIVALLGAAMISATFTEPLAHLAAPVVERRLHPCTLARCSQSLQAQHRSTRKP